MDWEGLRAKNGQHFLGRKQPYILILIFCYAFLLVLRTDRLVLQNMRYSIYNRLQCFLSYNFRDQLSGKRPDQVRQDIFSVVRVTNNQVKYELNHQEVCFSPVEWGDLLLHTQLMRVAGLLRTNLSLQVFQVSDFQKLDSAIHRKITN